MSLSKLLALSTISFLTATWAEVEDGKIKPEVSVQKIEVRQKEVNATDSNESNASVVEEKGMFDKIVDKSKELAGSAKELAGEGAEAVSSAASSAWNSTKKAASSAGTKASNYVKDYFKSTWEQSRKNVEEQKRKEREEQQRHSQQR